MNSTREKRCGTDLPGGLARSGDLPRRASPFGRRGRAPAAGRVALPGRPFDAKRDLGQRECLVAAGASVGHLDWMVAGDVHEHPPAGQVSRAPDRQGADDLAQFHTAVREGVLGPRGMVRVHPPRNDAAFLEQLEPAGQQPRGRAEGVCQVLELPRAIQQVANNQERPAFADDFKRERHRTDLPVVSRHVGMISQIRRLTSQNVVTTICECTLPIVARFVLAPWVIVGILSLFVLGSAVLAIFARLLAAWLR